MSDRLIMRVWRYKRLFPTFFFLSGDYAENRAGVDTIGALFLTFLGLKSED